MINKVAVKAGAVKSSFVKVGNVEVNPKYEGLVNAGIKQNIPMDKIFAKVADSNGNGIPEYSYPLVDLDANGAIPVEDGKGVVASAAKVKSALKVAAMQHEADKPGGEETIGKIKAAMDGFI